MRVQIIRPEELRLTANGPGVPGQEGVIYQTPRNGSTMSRTYIWNGERHVQFGQPEVEALVSGDWVPPSRTVGADNEQPVGIIKPVKRFGRLAANFLTGLWTLTGSAATVTQGYTGWDGNGAKTGIVSRTGQQAMLKVAMGNAAGGGNTSHEITLTSIATNMLQRQLGGKLGLWVYIERQPGYQPAGTLAGTLQIDISTTTGGSNAMYAGWNSNQIKEGWNFLKFVQRNPAAYVTGSGVVEYHPFGTVVSSFGTGADTDIVNGTVNRLRINWSNMADATLYFDSLWTDFDVTPQICLGNDAGINLVEIALPIFQQYGWVGYAAFPFNVVDSGTANFTQQPDLMGYDPSRLQTLYSAGWDVINHTLTHASLGTYTSEAAIVAQMRQSQAWLAEYGFVRGMEFYASPQSSSSRLSDTVIRQLGFKLQRHARGANVAVTPFGIPNPDHIGSIDMGGTTSSGVSAVTGGAASSVMGWQIASRLIRMLDVCEAYGDTLHAFWHGITTSGDTGSGEDLTGDNLLLTASAFRRFCDDVRARELAGRLIVCKGMTGFYYGTN